MKQQDRQQITAALTSQIMHKHYCENDGEAIIELLGEPFSWFGPGEQEYAVGKDVMAGVLRQFKGLVPKCNITDEEYDVLEITPEIHLCTGRMWITTDPSTNVYLRVHQRVTTIFLWQDDEAKCCHLHLSNPYTEMMEDDVGFPTQMGRHSFEYLQEQILAQKKQIEMQTTLLERLSYEDTLTGLFNRNKFNQKLAAYAGGAFCTLGIACFDLNGLKPINDQFGHSFGDSVIRRTARIIDMIFNGFAYRIGGDEFVVIDEKSDESTFRAAVASVIAQMKQEEISISVGLSWRAANCNIKEQFDEADRLMYEEKARHYNAQQHDRRQRQREQFCKELDALCSES